MFGSEILEVAVGLVLVYLLLSVIATSIREGVESVLKARAANLERGIRELLQHDRGGKALTTELFNHPMVFSLFRGDYPADAPADAGWLARMTHQWKRNLKLPSYIPARSFASALLDIAAQKSAPANQPPEDARVDLSTIRRSLDRMENVPEPVRQALRHAIDSAQGDLEKARKNLEAWYDSAMDRVSGWYKRQTQWIVLAVALVLTVSLNANTITIADDLYRNGDARRALLVAAEKRADSAQAPNGAAVRRDSAADRAYAELVDLHLPIGWPNGFHLELAMIPGFLITTFAIMLGAPFWFDVLNKVMIVRSTVKPHQKSPEASSDDRQQRRSDEETAAMAAAIASATSQAMRSAAPPTPPVGPPEGFTLSSRTDTSAAQPRSEPETP